MLLLIAILVTDSQMDTNHKCLVLYVIAKVILIKNHLTLLVNDIFFLKQLLEVKFGFTTRN